MSITWRLAFHKGMDPRESKQEATMPFMTEPWKLHIVVSVIAYWLASSLWEGSTQKHEYQGMRIVGAWLPQI